MSSQWKSLPRYHCKYCNYWCVDNKINRENHENSDRHKQNVERYLSNQKTAKERQAAKEKEVARIIRKAEEDARGAMSGVSDRRRISKKNAYLSADRPAITIQYDRIDGNTMPYPTLYGGTPFLYQPMGMGMPVMYNAATGNIPPPPPIVYDEKTGNIPPPPPMVYNEATGNIPPPPPIVYDEKTGNIPPPPPMESGDTAGAIPPPPPPTTEMDSAATANANSTATANAHSTATMTPHVTTTANTHPTTTESTSTSTPPIHYNFDYESKLTEEDLFGSWKTVSVTKLTEEDLEKREQQYDQAVMKSDRAEINRHKNGQKGAQKKKPVATNSEDEDEKDAFDMFNPFGGTYKGVQLSGDDPMYIPEQTAKRPVAKQETAEKPLPEQAPPPAANPEPAPQQFISTPVSFSFAPQKKPEPPKPKSSSLSAFFS